MDVLWYNSDIRGQNPIFGGREMKRSILFLVGVVLLAGSVSADTFGTGENEFTIDFVNISGDSGDLGSWDAGYTFSGVNHGDYRMGTYEITNDQFAKFAANTPYWTGADVPANQVSWYEGAQFVNYLNTSTGHQAAYNFTGSTFSVWKSGDAGYDSSNPFRNTYAYYFMPTEDEWVKAAYWNGTSLQTYANASAGDLVSGIPDPAKWNYSSSSPWDTENGSMELNGTYNMMGNVWEWTESPYDNGVYAPGGTRGIRGGAYVVGSSHLMSSQLVSGWPVYEEDYIGFRVASVAPCDYILIGDVNDDCKFDLRDFAEMSMNWLIDCFATPGDPACVPK